MNEDDDYNDSAHSGQSAMATEETLVVRYYLANLSEASPVNATRMFNSGSVHDHDEAHLLVQHGGVETGAGMSAMCPAISSESIEKATSSNPAPSSSRRSHRSLWR